mmetsp:Transcript_6636/g.15756  ORF Transcript_6636/g.15756 Transcript_6636/m.15756 type:complete len:266 (+) Transcript_6636:36-833(+)
MRDSRSCATRRQSWPLCVQRWGSGVQAGAWRWLARASVACDCHRTMPHLHDYTLAKAARRLSGSRGWILRRARMWCRFVATWTWRARRRRWQWDLEGRRGPRSFLLRYHAMGVAGEAVRTTRMVPKLPERQWAVSLNVLGRCLPQRAQRRGPRGLVPLRKPKAFLRSCTQAWRPFMRRLWMPSLVSTCLLRRCLWHMHMARGSCRLHLRTPPTQSQGPVPLREAGERRRGGRSRRVRRRRQSRRKRSTRATNCERATVVLVPHVL